MPIRIEVKADDDGQRLDRYLRAHTGMNYVQTQKNIRTGRVRVNGGRVRADCRLSANDIITAPQFIDTPDAVRNNQPLPRLPEGLRLFETPDYLILNKPAGLATQGGVRTALHLDLLLEHFCESDGVKPRLVHRLDKATSGIVLTARHRLAAIDAARGFKHKQIVKIYLAITNAPPPEEIGSISASVKKLKDKMIVADDGLTALSHYRAVSQAGAHCLLLLMPVTGRTHQLRVHLKHVNAPIVGDDKYGLSPSRGKHLMLHAYHLAWQQKHLNYSAPLPAHFTQMLERLGLDCGDDALKHHIEAFHLRFGAR